MFPQAYLYLMNNAHFYLDIIENRLFYDPSLTHKGGSGGKSDRLFRLYLDKFGYFMTAIRPIGEGGGGNLTGYLDSSHKVSQYLVIHCKSLKARIK